MTMPLDAAISHQIKDVITKHLENLNHYLAFSEPLEGLVPDNILHSIGRLVAMTQADPEKATASELEDMYCCQRELEAFLRLMNQEVDAAFQETQLGRILAQAASWWNVATQKNTIPLKTIWELLSPAQPDCLNELGDGVYEARWWSPVPMMDVEILQRTEGVLIQSEPIEPQNLAGGLAVRFSVYNV